MGYYSDVKILMGMKAYDVLKTICQQSEKEHVRAMVEQPSSLSIDEGAQSVLIGWENFKWYEGYAEIDTIEEVLGDLCEWVSQEPETYPLKDYYFKKIRIGEDNETEEFSNDRYNDYTADFYAECHFSL